MSNVNFSAFMDDTQNTYAMKDIAEAYMQMYQYAAEDFTSQPDIDTYIKAVTAWMKSVDKRLTQQMMLISSHTHMIPPHAHPGGKGGPIPLITLTPINAASIKWAAIPYPQYINTTLTIPNMSGNFIATSIASEGSIWPKIRRAKQIPITLKPLLSPTLQDSLKSTVGG
ncbi:hypothetical protein FDH01_gp017 [Acinetobacter phage vB_AbaM_ME3]|uniref:Uncharacterized protein n=1 Tax=Acinetobacter phage vB_AbaM_ME3 TaxID=1837876 RepID=A0A172PZZ1_9CAUD|nr:hypothetical protein FDH01_gp017 [Acinetobacter phage vB_AbaM_ME3]AND75178.1 hypothetical protein ME3_17 [Acinetobacter phage vB_AbaM_ME3]